MQLRDQNKGRYMREEQGQYGNYKLQVLQRMDGHMQTSPAIAPSPTPWPHLHSGDGQGEDGISLLVPKAWAGGAVVGEFALLDSARRCVMCVVFFFIR